MSVDLEPGPLAIVGIEAAGVTMRSYVRRAKLSRNSPAGKLGL
jgi:hypothetical protein